MADQKARGLLIVLCDPVQGADEEAFNRWYSEVHAPEIIARGAAVSFRRFKASGIPLMNGVPEPASYVAVYEIEAETVTDVQAIEQRLQDTKHLSTGVDPALDRSSVRAAYFLPVD